MNAWDFRIVSYRLKRRITSVVITITLSLQKEVITVRSQASSCANLDTGKSSSAFPFDDYVGMVIHAKDFRYFFDEALRIQTQMIEQFWFRQHFPVVDVAQGHFGPSTSTLLGSHCEKASSFAHVFHCSDGLVWNALLPTYHNCYL